MRSIIIIFTIVFFFAGCQKTPELFLQKKNENKYIALQPLGSCTEAELAVIKSQLTSFFNVKVITLTPQVLRPDFELHSDRNYYSADSLIRYLLQFKTGTIVEVVGVTHKEIYTIKKQKQIVNNNDTLVENLNLVFGFGYVEGNACVISDYKLVSTDTALYNNRLRKVVLHEIGHNLGLLHCLDTNCIMSEENGNMGNLNKPGGNYCTSCRQLLP